MKGFYVSDSLKKVDGHDQVILDLLQENQDGFTSIQIANELKRDRNDVKFSMERLLIAKKIKKGNSYNYGKWTLANFDFTEQIISKRPEEAAAIIKTLKEENERKDELIKDLADRLNTALCWVPDVDWNNDCDESSVLCLKILDGEI